MKNIRILFADNKNYFKWIDWQINIRIYYINN
jgi:hypothetical protein